MNVSSHSTWEGTIKPVKAQAKVQKKAEFLFSSLFLWNRRNQLCWYHSSQNSNLISVGGRGKRLRYAGPGVSKEEIGQKFFHFVRFKWRMSEILPDLFVIWFFLSFICNLEYYQITKTNEWTNIKKEETLAKAYRLKSFMLSTYMLTRVALTCKSWLVLLFHFFFTRATGCSSSLRIALIAHIWI